MFDVVVIGAGAAGMMAAARAAEHGAVTLVLEKNRKTGVKILMSGGTRCNLTHDCEASEIMQAFGSGGRFLRQALNELGPRETVRLFNRLGVETKVESTGKVFPASDRAVEVRDALQGWAKRAGARIELGVSVEGVFPEGDQFIVKTKNGVVACRRVVVTSGGRSWPGCGTTGDGYGWLHSLGHSITKTRPALVPLTGGFEWTKQLSGLTLERAAVKVWESGNQSNRKPSLERIGGFLFTHLGFSGPTVMDASGVITAAASPSATRFQCDWLPDMGFSQLEQWLETKRAQSGKQRIVAALGELLPKRLVEALCEQAGAMQTPLGELSKQTRTKLIHSVKQIELPITGTRGFEKAEVTAGGVALSEVDPRTMASRLIPGLYIAGEILDLDGWIGGYNFQSAFSTGHVAGMHAATACKTGS